MIKSFKHKGLANFFTTGSKKGIQPEHAKKLDVMLAALAAATRPGEMDTPGFGFHPLKHWGGYSLRVDGNYRVTFDWVEGNAVNVDYLDYH